MKGKIYIVLILMVIATILIACSRKTPECSDAETLKLVRQIILEKTGGNQDLSKKENQESIKIENPLATAFDEKAKRYSCEAKVDIVGKGILPITYYSQLDDKNKHIVSVDDI